MSQRWKGNLSKATESAIPNLKFSGSRVTADDFDQDGDLDLFVGSRFVPGRYPTDPESALLINQGGQFSRLDSPVNSSGMVTDAKWSDIDGDKRPDLIVATEWGPVRVYQNKENGFHETTKIVGLEKYSGWWNCVTATDIDKDGDAISSPAISARTLNTRHPSKTYDLFASDFDENGHFNWLKQSLRKVVYSLFVDGAVQRLLCRIY